MKLKIFKAGQTPRQHNEVLVYNLKAMAAYMETLPQELIVMRSFRYDEGAEPTHVCNTSGCIIGHCTALLTPKQFDTCIQNVHPLNEYVGGINFGAVAIFLLGRKNWDAYYHLNYMFEATAPNDKRELLNRMHLVTSYIEANMSETQNLLHATFFKHLEGL